MSVMIQIRNVPDDLHRKLKARAALAGKSLSDYLLTKIRSMAEVPTPQEVLERLESRSRVSPKVPTARLLRDERERR
jgi:antitoxin FitA